MTKHKDLHQWGRHKANERYNNNGIAMSKHGVMPEEKRNQFMATKETKTPTDPEHSIPTQGVADSDEDIT